MNDNSKKICIFPNDPIIAYYNKGEIKNRYYNPSDLFDEVHIISFVDLDIDESKVQSLAGNAKLKIHCVGKVNLKNYKSFEGKILQLMKEINPNIIRAYNSLIQGWLASRIAKKLNIPVVISVHTNYKQQRKESKNKRDLLKYLKLTYTRKIIEKPVLENADAVICVYDFIVPYAKDMGAKNISVIYNKVDLNKFSPKQSKEFNSSKPTILSVGRLIDQKDQSVLIKSIKDLDVELIIIGDGPNYQRLLDLIKQLRVENKVKIIKRVANEELNKYYVSCDIYAQPMMNLGGIPMPVLEAMASGLPIVMSKKEGNEIIDDAILFVENKPKEFQNAIKEILSNDNFKNGLIKKGLEIIRKIDANKMNKKEVELYKKLINVSNKKNCRHN